MPPWQLTLVAVATAALLAPALSQQSPVRTLLDTQSTPESACCAKLAAIGFSSSLPVVILDSGGAKIPYKVDTPAHMCTCSPGGEFPDYSGPVKAAGRGSSSANFTKKSFKVKTLGPDGKAADVALLGMPADDDWILYGPEADRTLGVRSSTAYGLYRAAGRYASRFAPCEVFLVDDGAPLGLQHYNGVYQVQEKIKRAKNRVDIAKLTQADPSGGYIFVYDNDNVQAGDIIFGPLPGWDHPFQLKDPDAFLPGDSGAWLTRYLTDFQTALEAPDWLSSSSGGNSSRLYASFIDVPSFVDYFLLTEQTKNPDGYRGSTYFHKDRGAGVAAGPPWDYDEAFGECCGYPIEGWQRGGKSGPGASGGSAISPEGWRFSICGEPGRCVVDPTDGSSRWFQRLWEDPEFRAAAARRWAELRAGPWADAALKAATGGAAEALAAAAERNYAKYYAVLGVQQGGDYAGVWRGQVADLEAWTLARAAWLDGALAAQRPVEAASGPGAAP